MSSKSFFSFFSLFFQYLVASIGIEIDFFFKKEVTFLLVNCLLSLWRLTSGLFVILLSCPGMFFYMFFHYLYKTFVMHYFLYLDSFQQSADFLRRAF